MLGFGLSLAGSSTKNNSAEVLSTCAEKIIWTYVTPSGYVLKNTENKSCIDEYL